jgi:hypothetical protein
MITHDRGAALVLAMMAVGLLAALAFSLSILTSVEMRVAANFTHAYEAMAAAETALEFAAHEILGIADWSSVTAGSVRSTFVDGLPGGSRTLADGTTVDLTVLTARLGKEWRLFAYGKLDDLEKLPSQAYIVVWAAPDPAGRPGMLALRADALGASGTRKAVQAAISRSGIRLWQELR